MNSTPIDSLRNRSRRGWLCAGVVNLGDQTEHISHFTSPQSPWENGRDRFEKFSRRSWRIRFLATCARNAEGFSPLLLVHWKNLSKRVLSHEWGC